MTTDEKCVSDDKTPHADFVEHVKDALENLYDVSTLRNHALARLMEQAFEPPTMDVGQWLRRELVDAIETLNPGANVPIHTPQARFYNLLVLRYVECRTVQEAAHTVDISRRQAHRDLRKGVEKLAATLWARRSTPTAPKPRALQLSSLRREVARLEPHPQPIDVGALLEQSQETVAPLAVQRAVQFDYERPKNSVIVSADPAVAEQVLVNLLSKAVQHAQSGRLDISLTNDRAHATIALGYSPEHDGHDPSFISPVIAQLIDQLGWVVEQQGDTEGRHVVALHMDICGPNVLVIDDNAGLVELIARYLTDHACRVIAASDGDEGLKLAQDLLPDAIVLDVMIPGLHGWDVLQRLRSLPKTADIPVIVCSVINDPELAYSLGASLFLPKPMSRAKILDALNQLDVV
jgi:CheY-like chemotaxis protein